MTLRRQDSESSGAYPYTHFRSATTIQNLLLELVNLYSNLAIRE